MRRQKGLAGLIGCAAALGCRPLPPAVPGGDATIRSVMNHALPPMEGRHLAVTVLEVSYGPGGSSQPHSHPCPVIGFVVEGALRMQVQGEPEATYRAGGSFYEAANGVHLLSANASDTEPVRFLAYFTCDHDAPLSVAAPAADVTRDRDP